jgi:hypothetical protein
MEPKKNSSKPNNKQQLDTVTGEGPTPPHDGGGPRLDASSTTPTIEPERTDAINVGAGGTLIVPREDFDGDIDEGAEVDLISAQPKKIRKPDRREWIALKPASELPTRLLLHKPKADGIEVEHYYVDKALRGPIREELKNVRVFVFYSFKTKSHGLWVINVTLDNNWYESLAQLLKHPTEFFDKNAIRVISDKANSRYRVRYKPMPSEVAWPEKPTNELLTEALGQSRFITSPEHPVYRDLVEGVELS